MTRPQMEYKISLGNMLNMIALAVAVAVSWGVMSERNEATRTQMQEVRDTLGQEVDARIRTQDDFSARLRALETNQARSDERFNSVLQVLGRIEARLERIETR